MKINRMMITLFFVIFSIMAEIDCSYDSGTVSTCHVAITDLRSVTSDGKLKNLEIVGASPIDISCIPMDYHFFPGQRGPFCFSDMIERAYQPRVASQSDQTLDSEDSIRSDKKLNLGLVLVSLLYNYGEQSLGTLWQRQSQEKTVQEAMAQGYFMREGMWEVGSLYSGMGRLRVVLRRVSLDNSEVPLDIDGVIERFSGSTSERAVREIYMRGKGRYADAVKETLSGESMSVKIPFEIIKLLVDGFLMGLHTK